MSLHRKDLAWKNSDVLRIHDSKDDIYIYIYIYLFTVYIHLSTGLYMYNIYIYIVIITNHLIYIHCHTEVS